jgi:MFS family permease
MDRAAIGILAPYMQHDLSLDASAMGIVFSRASISEVVPMNRVGVPGGFIHFLANLSSVLSPAITGFAVAYFGSYDAAFFLAATIAFVAAVIVLALLRRPQPTALGLDGKALILS